jgi:L-asparaginase
VIPAVGLRYLQPAYRLGHTYALAPGQIAAFPRVDIVTSYLGGDDALLRAALKAGAKGVVVAGFGSGTMTPAVDEAASEIAQSGVPVVFSSRVLTGTVHDGSYGAERRPDQFVRSGFLNPAKARILLLVHLASGAGETLKQAFAPY